MDWEWVLFDYGGTLTRYQDPASVPAKPRNAYGQALAQWFRMTGRSGDTDADHLQALTEQAHRMTEGQPTPLDWVYNESFYVRWMRWIYRQLQVPEPVTEHELACAWHFMCWSVGQRYSAPACPSVVRTLDELRQRGYRLGVLSNNSGYTADALLYGGIARFFEIVVDSSREGRVKPDPELFRSVARRVQTPCPNILYVGDSYECDIIGATLAGMGAAWVGGDQRVLPAAAFRIDTIPDLLPRLPRRSSLPS